VYPQPRTVSLPRTQGALSRDYDLTAAIAGRCPHGRLRMADATDAALASGNLEWLTTRQKRFTCVRAAQRG
jgi:hypothetical protein